MNAEFKKQMKENGAEVEAALGRFLGNEALYMKFIVKFLDDENYTGTIQSIEARDYEAAFQYAHSLKGITANLGLEPVRAAASQITDLLRNRKSQEIDEKQLMDYKEELETVYKNFQKIIEENRRQKDML